MLSVLVLTYQRHKLLEEAMQSYLEQDFQESSEMVVLNDSPAVKYHTKQADDPKKRFRIINHSTRFSSIGKKLEYGYKQCFGSHLYRLDDDDLLMPNALSLVQKWINADPTYDVYRSGKFYWFGGNKYAYPREGINTGNVLSKEYVNRLTFPDKNADEDLDIVFSPNVKMMTVENEPYTMIYRWGVGNHISTQLHLPNEDRLKFIPEPESGDIELFPHFDHNYYGQIHAL
jgi:glycosyltransferase involved in cell wall biosynthesis